MGKWITWIVASAMTIPVMAGTQIDLTTFDSDMVGPRAQVLVLGSMHLSEMPKDFNPAALDGVLDRLAAYKPDIITVEDLPGEECDLAARNPEKYGTDYCASTEAAKAATGLDMPAALAQINTTLKAWPAQPTPAQRRHLAALFLAANERTSAYVQWLLLPKTEQHVGDALNDALVKTLGQIATRNNESYQIGARLAARLGLQRIYAIDNHTGDNIDIADTKAFMKDLNAAWTADGAELNAREKSEEPLAQSTDLLPMYRSLNDPEGLKIRAEANVRAAMRGKSAAGYPQWWVAGWEIRNLRMVANIRETFRERPGARVLSIVGATHKPWFDNWLGQLQGVEIIDVEEVLK